MRFGNEIAQWLNDSRIRQFRCRSVMDGLGRVKGRRLHTEERPQRPTGRLQLGGEVLNHIGHGLSQALFPGLSLHPTTKGSVRQTLLPSAGRPRAGLVERHYNPAPEYGFSPKASTFNGTGQT